MHILTQVRDATEEGEPFVTRQMLYARQKGGAYEVTASAADLEPREEEAPYQIVFDTKGHPFVVTATSKGLTVLEEGLQPMSAGDIPEGSRNNPHDLTSGGLGKAFSGLDWRQGIDVIWGTSVFRIVAGGSFQNAYYAVPDPCTFAEECYFDPASLEAAVWTETGPLQTLRLACGGTECDWYEYPPLAESTHDRIATDALDRAYFHTPDGTPTMVWIGSGGDAGTAKAVIATRPDSETTLMVGDPVHIGAAPRHGKGLAAAVLESSGALRLLVAGHDLDVQTIDLGSIENGSQGIGVHTLVDTDGEVVHVVLRETSTAVAHFRVKVADGTFTKETIEML